MKIKQKLLLDFVLFIMIWLCMEYDLTGGFLHELLGLVLLAGLIFHIVMNRRYYGYMLNNITKASESPKRLASLIVNILLLVAVIVMLISSLAISNSLLSFASQFIGHRSFWRILHIASAIVLFICTAIHIFLHKELYYSLLKKAFPAEKTMSVMRAGMRVLSVFVMVIVIKTSVIDASHIPQIQDSGNQQNDSAQIEMPSDSSTYTVPSTDGTPTLEEYLKGKTCSGCGRCCSLLSIRCSRGNEPKNAAIQEYNSTYN